jgi:hypothetical protein
LFLLRLARLCGFLLPLLLRLFLGNAFMLLFALERLFLFRLQLLAPLLFLLQLLLCGLGLGFLLLARQRNLGVALRRVRRRRWGRRGEGRRLGLRGRGRRFLKAGGRLLRDGGPQLGLDGVGLAWPPCPRWAGRSRWACEHGRRHHEDDEQHQHHVDERAPC